MNEEENIVISSWSGGKDSCLACYKAIKSGHNVQYLLNFTSKKSKRCCFHGIEATLLNHQADCIKIPLHQREVSSDMKAYEEEFKVAVGELQSKGVKKMIFGDVYLDEHKSWVERVCREIGIEPIEPLWGISAQLVVEDFINSGFKAIVVSASAKYFNKDIVGRLIDIDFLTELKKKNICPCGENGEFHTLVLDGPLFERKIEITESIPILKKGFWEYWFLDIKRYELKKREEVNSIV